jgi:Fe-S cluster assembly scaffold protein SufB
MNDITKKLLSMISDISGEIKGAFNIREDGGCAGRQSTENVDIIPKVGQPGIDIIIKPNTKEKIYIPACVTKSNVDDLVYNDFYVGENSDVVIVAGCGVHTDGEEDSQHNGIHRFFISKNAKVRYEEKHVGIGEGTGKRINPQTYIEMAENSYMEMDTVQIKGVDSTKRDSKAVLQANAKLVIKEKIMTHGEQYAETNFAVDLDGEDSGVDLISRSVARGTSKQMFRSVINGNTRCTGHSECDAIIMDKGVVSAIPELTANDIDAALIHEAAIGKIAGEQLIKLMTLGLTSEEAEAKIVEGFLK